MEDFGAAPLLNASAALQGSSWYNGFGPAPMYELVPEPPLSYPIYHVPRTSLLSFASDKTLNIVLPVLTYWLVSLFFHWLDNIPSLDRYRLHTPPEIASRNKVTIVEVVRAVIIQQVFQILLGCFTLPSETAAEVFRDHRAEMAALSGWVAAGARLLLGGELAGKVLAGQGQRIVEWVYWWGIPIAQFWFACFIMDTHQYFLHRLFHVNKFLYRHVHSVHHRLYVPYAFGALYNHPLEGFLLDSVGAWLAHQLSFMTIRQSTILFCFATIKTCSDHSGAAYPLDPIRLFFTNTADYHDIHHQQYGFKYNYSQPFFVHWDEWLGTRMTRAQASEKRHSRTGKGVEKEE